MTKQQMSRITGAESGPLTYQKKFSRITAYKITMDNIYDVARWCGGDVLTSDVYEDVRLLVPTTSQIPLYAYPLQYLVRNHEGKYELIDEETMTRTYERLSLIGSVVDSRYLF